MRIGWWDSHSMSGSTPPTSPRPSWGRRARSTSRSSSSTTRTSAAIRTSETTSWPPSGYVKIERGVEVHHDGDLPARSGIGSSSSFTVGLLHALHALKGQMVSKHELATQGIHLEQDVLRETVGSQDQVSAAYGGFNHIVF